MEKKTTMDDIAKRLGISKNAVSLALRNKPGISDALRERVFEVAQSLHYHKMGRIAATMNFLALVPGRLSVRAPHSFYADLCFFMESFSKDQGHNLVIASVDREEERQCLSPAILHSIHFSGIFVIGNLSLPYIKMLSGLGLPIVMVDQYYLDLPLTCVVTANASGAYLLTSHLIENGHRDIGFMGNRSFTSSLFDRWRGYCQAMTDNRLPIGENCYQTNLSYRGEDDSKYIEASLDQYAKMPSAFLCGSDYVAGTLIHLLSERGYSVPEDVSVAGFDDLSISMVALYQLSTYRTPREAMARQAIQSMLEPVSPARTILIHGEPVYRKTVQPWAPGVRLEP